MAIPTPGFGWNPATWVYEKVVGGGRRDPLQPSATSNSFVESHL